MADIPSNYEMIWWFVLGAVALIGLWIGKHAPDDSVSDEYMDRHFPKNRG